MTDEDLEATVTQLQLQDLPPIRRHGLMVPDNLFPYAESFRDLVQLYIVMGCTLYQRRVALIWGFWRSYQEKLGNHELPKAIPALEMSWALDYLGRGIRHREGLGL